DLHLLRKEVGESRRSAPIGHVQHACARHLLNNSQKMCDVEPTPADATVRASGLAFAAAISSGTDCTANAGCTTRCGFPGWFDGGGDGPGFHGPAGLMVVARCLMRAASGQAAAKARRMRDAVSITRAPSLMSRRRMVANSAFASACALGIASRNVSMSQ